MNIVDWQNALNEYTKLKEPDKAYRCYAWKTAIGLQDVDGLRPSEYLVETAKEHIEGNIDIDTAKARITSYYEQRGNRQSTEADTKEADIVSVRIAELLSEKTFQLSPVELTSIHHRLFNGIIKHAGTYRPYNISKNEWVLNDKSVIYSSYGIIKDTLDYDFSQEKNFSYKNITNNDFVKHFSSFISGIWQIHPFCEGNTRTTAVFSIRYLKALGFEVTNDLFAENSWYFRNALVRANYNDIKNNIHQTSEYLEKFFENLLFDAKHELKNRNLHVDNTTERQIIYPQTKGR